jgi:pyridoxamine 5'-phosphate oxidase
VDKKEILEFITKNPTSFLATTDGKKPHVRAFGTFRADEKGIVYFTQSAKDVYKQMVKYPDIEACYWANGVQIRVAGKVTAVEDMAIKKAVVEKAPFLKPQIDEHGWDFLKIFVIKNGKATVLDMKGPPSPPGAPKVWVDL